MYTCTHMRTHNYIGQSIAVEQWMLQVYLAVKFMAFTWPDSAVSYGHWPLQEAIPSQWIQYMHTTTIIYTYCGNLEYSVVCLWQLWCIPRVQNKHNQSYIALHLGWDVYTPIFVHISKHKCIVGKWTYYSHKINKQAYIHIAPGTPGPIRSMQLNPPGPIRSMQLNPPGLIRSMQLNPPGPIRSMQFIRRFVGHRS